MEFVILDYHKI